MDIDRSAKTQLINRVSHLLIPMVAMPLLGGWFLAVIPADSRSWVMGGSAAMMLFFSVSIAASLAIGAYAMVGMVWQKMYINGATATLLLMLAFGATAGGEFVREGARKPFTIRQVLYSNSIRPEDVERLREVGCLADDPYPIRDAGAYPDEQLREGARVFRRQCAVCHTVKGANAVVHLTGSWDIDQMRMNIAKLQHTKPFMPPFAGTAAELESLVQFILWSSAGSPATRVPDDQAVNHETLRQITHWLEEAGTKPGVFDRNHHAPSKSDKSDSDTGANHG